MDLSCGFGDSNGVADTIGCGGNCWGGGETTEVATWATAGDVTDDATAGGFGDTNGDDFNDTERLSPAQGLKSSLFDSRLKERCRERALLSVVRLRGLSGLAPIQDTRRPAVGRPVGGAVPGLGSLQPPAMKRT